jgi:hypothetical protein
MRRSSGRSCRPLVTEANLRIGNESTNACSDASRRSRSSTSRPIRPGLVGLYLDAGYRALLMDWDNPAAHHPEWPAETRYLPQRASGSDGREHRAVVDQHRRVPEAAALRTWRHRARRVSSTMSAAAAARGRARSAFTPAMRRSSISAPALQDGRGHWQCQRMEAVRRGSLALQRARLRSSSRPASLGLAVVDGANLLLRLESADCPVPVKKQRKYSLARWAVTGRDDVAVNAACERICRGLVESESRRARLERALLSLVERFPHAHHRKALDGVLRAPRAQRATMDCGNS